MSAELCRRPGALSNFLRLRRHNYRRSFREYPFLEGRTSLSFTHGEPQPLPSPEGLDVYVHLLSRHQTRRATASERVVYRMGYGKPSALAEEFRRLATGAKRNRNPLKDPRASQAEKLSEGLRREREGTLSRSWRSFLQNARSHLAGEFALHPSR